MVEVRGLYSGGSRDVEDASVGRRRRSGRDVRTVWQWTGRSRSREMMSTERMAAEESSWVSDGMVAERTLDGERE